MTCSQYCTGKVVLSRCKLSRSLSKQGVPRLNQLSELVCTLIATLFLQHQATGWLWKPCFATGSRPRTCRRTKDRIIGLVSTLLYRCVVRALHRYVRRTLLSLRRDLWVLPKRPDQDGCLLQDAQRTTERVSWNKAKHQITQQPFKNLKQPDARYQADLNPKPLTH